MLEQWKVIEEDRVLKDTFLVSNLGRVKTRTRTYYCGKYPVKRTIKGGVLKPSETGKTRNGKGYLGIPLRCEDGGQRSFLIHRLVAKYFLPDWDENLTVNHIDEDRFNNKVSNLEMVTQLQNNNHGDRKKKVEISRETNKWSGKCIRQAVKLTNIIDGTELYFPSKGTAQKFLRVQQHKLDNVLSGKRTHVHGWKAERISTARYRENLVPKT